MRVLHVLDALDPAGEAGAYADMLRHLPATDTHDVAVLGAAPPSAGRQRVVAAPTAEALSTLLRDGGYGITCVTSYQTASLDVPIVSTSLPTRAVYWKSYDESARLRLGGSYASSTDDALLASSDHVAFATYELASLYDLPAGAAATVIGLAADIAPFVALRPPAATDTNCVLALGGTASRRHVRDLVAALAIVRRAVPDATVRVFGPGDGDDASRLAHAADEAGLAGACAVAGGDAAIAEELAHARIVAAPPGAPGSPVPLVESLAAGRPVVTTDPGHATTVIDDGVEGFLVPTGDIEGLAARLTTLLTNHALAATMGRAGRRRAARYSLETTAARLAALLASVGDGR
ncbi:MAG: glycosyltransferase family 4 protein [Vicinamibacterales bacterium]